MDSRDINKLQALAGEVDTLVSQNVTTSSPDFKAWRIGVKRLLSRVYGTDSVEATEFEKTSFSLHFWTDRTPDYLWAEACREGLLQTKAVLQSYIDDEEANATPSPVCEETEHDTSKVFVVHGHDGELRESVARLLEKQGITPVVLFEQANLGSTIIEKFEEHSDVGAAICLFTGDDAVVGDTSEPAKQRARQNVVFETGYFIGKLGRRRVVVIADRGVEMPSDLSGVLYVSKNNWQLDVLRELAGQGFDVDLNALL